MGKCGNANAYQEGNKTYPQKSQALFRHNAYLGSASNLGSAWRLSRAIVFRFVLSTSGRHNTPNRNRRCQKAGPFEGFL